MIWETDAALVLEELNEIRDRIVDCIEEYTSVNALMSEFENHYLAFVLLPSYHLQQTIQMGNYLEQEYNRISSAIQAGTLTEPDELEAEVKSTLHHADFAFGYLSRDLHSDLLRIPDLLDPHDAQDFVLTASQQEKLLKEFKKVVLPKVHSDTSEAPFAVFQTVYDAYKKKDFLIVAAFVIQYRGELPLPGEDLAVFLEMAPDYLNEYRAVLRGLEQRIKRLKEDPTSARLENAQEVLRQMKDQNHELRNAAIREAERVLFLRSCLEELTKRKKMNQGVN